MSFRHLALALLCALPASAAEPLTRLADIRALTPEAAAQDRFVTVAVTVTVYDPEVGSFFVSDGLTGIFIKIDYANRPAPAPRPGDRLRLEGYTQPGDYLPNVRLTKLEKLGSGPPLEPRRVTGAELQEPGPDCEWVELRAVVKATSVDKFGGLYFSLLTDGWHFTAYVSRMEKFKTPPWEFFERRVRVHAWSARTSTRSGRCAGAG